MGNCSKCCWRVLNTHERRAKCSSKWLKWNTHDSPVDEGVGLCTRHKLHRTDHMRNDKKRIPDSQWTAWFLCASTVRFNLPFKIKGPLMRFGSSCVILALRFSLHCSMFLWARNWGKILNPKKSCHQLRIGSALCIISHVVCTMRIMSRHSPTPSSTHCWTQIFGNRSTFRKSSQ